MAREDTPDSTRSISRPNRWRRPETIGGPRSSQAKQLSDDRARTPAHHRVPRTGSPAVPGTGSDRGRRRDLEHAPLSDPEPPDRNARRHFHARLRRQGAPRDGDAAHPRADGTRRNRARKCQRHGEAVPVAAERTAAGKLHPICAQNKVSACRDVRPARQDRQRRGFLFRRLLFRRPDHSAAAADREPFPRQARNQVSAERRQLLFIDAEYVGGLSQQHGFAKELRSQKAAAAP